jgi:radical SAM protein with 4Fe4S-binding SPASM domain
MKKSTLLWSLIRNGTMTPGRVFNASKVMASWMFGRRQPWGAPPILMFEPTNICNLKCPLCLTGIDDLRRVKGLMSYETYTKAIEQLADTGMILSLYLTGEPFLNKHLTKMIETAHRKKLFIRISTNGHFLTEPVREAIIKGGLDNLIVGIDGATEEVYLKFRKGGDFRKTLDNIRALVADKKRLGSSTPYIDMQFIITADNEHEIGSAKRLAEELGVDGISFKTVFVYDKKDKIPTEGKLSRYNDSEPYGRCSRLWWTTYMLWDGRVTPCCYDERGVHAVGNIHEKSFAEIWRGPEMDEFRRRELEEKNSIDICDGCSMKMLNYLPTEKVLAD